MKQYHPTPLSCLFPSIQEAEFNKIEAFEGVKKRSIHEVKAGTGIVIANFSLSLDHPTYWDMSLIDVDDDSQRVSRKPIAGEWITALVLDNYGGPDNWEFSPRNRRGSAELAPPPEKKKATGEVVYFLRAGDFVKIGKATGDAKNRVTQLRTGCPFPIEILAEITGGYDDESALHARFSGIRAHGEWFHATPELLSFISECAA